MLGDVEALAAELRRAPGHLDVADHLGNTPLLAATTRGDAGCVRLLLAAGADTRARNRAGQTALQVAASEGYDDCVHELMRALGPGAPGTVANGAAHENGAFRSPHCN